MRNELYQIDLDVMAAEIKKGYEIIAEWQDRRFKRMGAAMAKPIDPEYFTKLWNELRDKK